MDMAQLKVQPTPARPHPYLPSYAPVLIRGADEFQVGTDPSNALIFSGAGFGVLLEALDGYKSPRVVRSIGHAAGLSLRKVEDAFTALRNAGLLIDGSADPIPEFSAARIHLIGAGSLGIEIARLLIRSGIAELSIFDDHPPEPDLFPQADQYPTRSRALTTTLAPPSPTEVVAASHWSPGDDHRADLVVVVADGPEVNRAITEGLLRCDYTHLIVRSLGSGACVGPLVIPGRTACLGCHDLVRRSADPHWPTILTQLTRVRTDIAGVTASWVAAYTVGEILAFLHGEPPQLAGGTADLVVPDFVVRRRVWQAHPECGCSWLAPTQWGA